MILKRLLFIFTFAFVACSSETTTQPKAVLKLAVTTSTHDSGLLEVLLPPFEKQHKIRVDVISVGTGKALALGRSKDVQAVLVHSRRQEQEFMNKGYGSRHEELMVNEFQILGPKSDPAKIKGLSPKEAFQRIAKAKATFISRGDKSGTHTRETTIWRAADHQTNWDQYLESGQGMGATLIIADEKQAYTLCDRGTYLKFKKRIALRPLVGQGALLKNPYAIIVVSDKDASKQKSAQLLADYLIEKPAQTLMKDYRLEGEALFTPLRLKAAKNQN